MRVASAVPIVATFSRATLFHRCYEMMSVLKHAYASSPALAFRGRRCCCSHDVVIAGVAHAVLPPQQRARRRASRRHTLTSAASIPIPTTGPPIPGSSNRTARDAADPRSTTTLNRDPYSYAIARRAKIELAKHMVLKAWNPTNQTRTLPTARPVHYPVDDKRHDTCVITGVRP
jgi:hypothetical protein